MLSAAPPPSCTFADGTLHCNFIYKVDEVVVAEPGSTVVGDLGEQEWGSGCSPGACLYSPRCLAANSDHLLPLSQDIQDPVTGAGIHLQLPHQLPWYDGVKG